MPKNIEQDIAKVKNITIASEQAMQRIDNFLLHYCKGVPKSYIYKIIRAGQVRVNKSRAKPSYKLQQGDIVRIPPLRVSSRPGRSKAIGVPKHLQDQILTNILFEDDYLLILNKPSGLAVHGGSGINLGLIELLRVVRPDSKCLELVHRLDRDTSGCIIIAKKRSVLRALHAIFREGKIQKIYHALVLGQPKANFKVSEPLRKNLLQSGERIVKVDAKTGQPAFTKFKVVTRYKHCCLVEARPITGRMHQIRVHASVKNHPIAGDIKYGDKNFNALVKTLGLKRLFLHARSLIFTHPATAAMISVQANYDANLQATLDILKTHEF